MQKAPWWTQAIGAIKNIFASKEASGISQQKVNPFMLTKKQDEVAKQPKKVNKRKPVVTKNTHNNVFGEFGQ